MYVGIFMTSLDMSGFSLSVCTLDNERLAALDADTEVGPEAPRTALFCEHHALQLTPRPVVLACEAFLCEAISFLALPYCYRLLQAPAWPRCHGAHLLHKRPVQLTRLETDEQHMHRPARLSAVGSRMEGALAAICSALIDAAPELDALDAK